MSTTAQRMKKTVSVTIAPELYEQARQAKLNLSAILACALQAELKRLEAQKWKNENIDGFNELNRINEEYGLLSDKYKDF
ncbi:MULTISPECIES: type II toxin-antitoxin system CcdA family antitoxin [Providencia]|uniref:type II toxin-antitoxin system CcdA family antitoxin n=1 Tax=Providencia TaxID=586 RepID=UPI0018E4C22C|nr:MULTISPECIES: type II toxin-antitoxin system CcdA family antitoxin [Providencia]EJD6376046.1 type II toxin-antitoxin system CcdA family antitoxin [Providencia rettgeri]EJF7710313.1 type II toxin-antitoxin system CcdA family antitoxin [Providencia rettgeri]ELR5118790.1 type II toxin-antitoxin system CcdA family antitoxin [Providencia rettgeri]MBI6201169.1 type II toxin-antitoxin system CcdA family antitoxin [Providencia rettgeri]MBQ0366698.1 type II toxin-antitoxin system CcdA family antitox